MSDDSDSYLAEHQIDRQLRRKGDGDRIEQKIGGNDRRVTRFLDWILPALALGALTYFGNKIDKLSDAIITTNTQIALIVEQNHSLQDGFKDHENRIRSLEGKTFRGVAGYGDEPKDIKDPGPRHVR